MAAVRSRAQVPVGSAQWVLDEQNLTDDFVAQEVEEFAFSARNEMEWLNEHMADIFNRSQFDVAEAFKTPGKLRGKTPRTARKRNAFETRAPLTDVFTANIQKAAPNSSHKSPFSKPIVQFHVAEDIDDSHVADTATSTRYSFGTGKENTDSGYHGMTEDEMEVDHTVVRSQPQFRSPPKPSYILSVQNQQPASASRPQEPTATIREESIDTFVSASEEAAAQQRDEDETEEDENATQPDEDMEITIAPPKADIPEDVPVFESHQNTKPASSAPIPENALEQAEPQSPAQPSIEADSFSPSSAESSPKRLLVRKKSSLTFASLPAREPLATKKSVGARTSHADPLRSNRFSRDDNLSRTTLGATKRDSQHSKPLESTSKLQQNEGDAAMDLNKDTEADQVSEATKEHSKTSTQRLQERLAMLGKTNAPRPSKSIPSTALPSQMAPTLDAAETKTRTSSRRASGKDENEESWIGPMKSQPQQEESSTIDPVPRNETVVEPKPMIPGKEDTERSKASRNLAESKVAYPKLPENGSAAPTTQTFESQASQSYPQPSRDTVYSVNPPDLSRSDGPISASKAKLFSVLKSAKGIFASSASVSAQAKIEALSSSQSLDNAAKHATSTRTEINGLDAPDTAMEDIPVNQPHHVGASAEDPQQDRYFAKNIEQQSTRAAPAPSRKVDEKTGDGKDTASSKETQKAAVEQPKVAAPVDDATASEGEILSQQNMPPPPPPKTQFSSSQMHKGELRRPNRPPKDAPPKSRPAPVSIRLASQRVGQMGPQGGVSAPSQPEPAPPAVPPKQPSLSKKTSTASLHTTSSTQSFKTTVSSASARPKALEAAARKKEQDEREAQRKAEQKREMERRRAAKAEEERRAAQEQKAAEQRAQEAKQQAQKQALEQRKADALRRTEQQRNQAAAARAKQPEELDAMPDNEPRQPPQNHARSEAPTIRPVSRVGNNQESVRPAAPHINPAKPPKRQFNPDEDKPLPARPGQGDQPKKRRRTSEESFVEAVSRPTMAPPVRPSMMRKENMNKFTQGFMNQANSSHAPSSMLKTTVNNQHQLQHPKTPHMNDLAKYTNARIPFADAPNLPQTGAFSTQQHHQQPRAQQPLKTPNSIATVAHKSSPQYPNGDAIDLPEIATDSEDSDDDQDFVPPDWANSPALRELLKEQQLVDPLKVFGPIAPLMMEDIFKGNKERLARFRNRTSSANWNGPDRLTEEEIKKDREARERLEREGGWTFGGST